MKVANIIEEARVGGPQRRIAAVAPRLKLFGIETVVIGPEHRGKRFASLLRDRGVSYHAQPLHPPLRGPRSFTGYACSFPTEVWKLSRVLRRGGFDLVHVSGGSWQIKGVIAARLANIPTLWHLNDTKRPLPIRVVFAIVARCLRTSFIVTGRAVRDYYLTPGRFDDRGIFEIQAPVDVDRFDPRRVIPDSRLSQRQRPVVVLLALLNPNKGVDTFVAIAERVVAEVPEAEFWIVGPILDTQTVYRQRMDELIRSKKLEGHVRFFGGTQEPASVLAAADVVVCTSRAEAGPMAVWEAMAMARPVVSTDVGDVKKYLERSQAGFVVPVDDTASGARSVIRLLRDPELRKAMGQRARAVAEEQLSLEKAVERHVAAYEATVKRRG